MLKLGIAILDNVWAIAAGDGDALSILGLVAIVLGVGLIGGSIIRLTTPNLRRLRLGLALVLFGFVGLSRIVGQAPAPDDTDTVTPDNTPVPSIEATAPARLRLPWDSEERQAKWPVCETLARLSDIAYLTPVEAEEAVSRLGFSGIMTLVDESMVGYIVWHEDAVVIVFRGTNPAEVSDWAVNLRDTTADTTHGGIHGGFWRAYQGLKPQVLKVLEKIPHEHLWITGHSLGGALALACAIDLSTNEQMAFDGLITFGQPKVVRSDLEKYVDAEFVGRYARVVMGDDMVARIPPSKVFCGSLVWFSEGKLERSRPLRIAYGNAGSESEESESVELMPLTEEEFARWKEARRANARAPEILPDEPPSYQGNSPYITDHDMKGYISRIQKHLGIEPE